MNKFSVLLLLMMAICSSYAQIYKWVDYQGNVHYSDVPHEGAETITIPEPQSYSSPLPPPTPSSKETQDISMSQKNAYTRLVIFQPENRATIRNNQGFVKVFVKVEPDLFPGDKLQILYDGVAQGLPQKNSLFEISGMYRGSHTLAAQIVGSEGQRIEASDSITIYVFRPRVGMVPNTKPR